MEQQPSLKKDKLNAELSSGDLISGLPLDLRVHILSFLPTKTVISTSALSQSWKSVWKKVPRLHFDRLTPPENVLKILRLHEAPVLESLSFSGEFDPSDVASWIGIAFEREVKELVVMVCTAEGRGPVIFPDIQSDNYTKLKILKVSRSVRLDLSPPIIFKSLTDLHLDSVEFQDGEAASNLLNRCPQLHDLVLQSYRFVNEETITIAVPSLEKLTLSNTVGNGGGGYKINSPSLKHLNIQWMQNLGFCLIQNAAQLVEANISNVFDVIQENILNSLVTAKRLVFLLSPLQIGLPHGHIFRGLLTLEMITFKSEWWNLLSHMLQSSPNLQNLKLTGMGKPTDNDMGPKGKDWNQPENVPECLWNSLHTLVWISYRWRQENEKNLATYILNNALMLKKAFFSTEIIVQTDSEESEELEKRRKMILNELANELRAGNPCELVVETDPVFDTDSDAEPDAGSDAEPDAEPDAGPDAEPDAGSDAEPDAGSDEESDTESDG